MTKKTTVKIKQKDRLAKKLLQLKADITTADRKAFLEKSQITKGNLSLYLNGTVYDSDKALEMYNFFNARIQQREKAIS